MKGSYFEKVDLSSSNKYEVNQPYLGLNCSVFVKILGTCGFPFDLTKLLLLIISNAPWKAQLEELVSLLLSWSTINLDWTTSCTWTTDTQVNCFSTKSIKTKPVTAKNNRLHMPSSFKQVKLKRAQFISQRAKK